MLDFIANYFCMLFYISRTESAVNQARPINLIITLQILDDYANIILAWRPANVNGSHLDSAL